MAKNKKITAVKVKKKKWYPILASKSFNQQVLGESLVTEPAKLKDKFMNINLSMITNNFRDQNLNLTFKVNSVQDNKGHTELVSYQILQSFIKRFVRRDKSKVADSFILKDKKNQKIRIKPLIITHNIATKSQKTELRRIAKEFLKKHMTTVTLEEFVSELIKKEVQRKMKSLFKKVMPIKYAEISTVKFESFKMIPSKKQEIVDEEVVEEIKKEEVAAKEEISEKVKVKKVIAENKKE